MTVFAAWMVLREKPLAAKKSDSEVLVLISTRLSHHLQKFCGHFVRFISEVLLTDSFFFYLLDLEHLLWGPIRHFADGSILHVHGLCLQ